MELNQEGLQALLKQIIDGKEEFTGLVIKKCSIESARSLIVNVLSKSSTLDIDKNIALKTLDNIRKRSGKKVDLTILSVNNNKFKLTIDLAEY